MAKKFGKKITLTGSTLQKPGVTYQGVDISYPEQPSHQTMVDQPTTQPPMLPVSPRSQPAPVNDTLVVPLHCGKVNATSKGQARILFGLKNDLNPSTDLDHEIARAWADFRDLPEVDYYTAELQNCYDNDYILLISDSVATLYDSAVEIPEVLKLSRNKYKLRDGAVIAAVHRGTILFLGTKNRLREYVRRCCTTHRNPMSAYESNRLMATITDSMLDTIISGMRPGYEALIEDETSSNECSSYQHWNDRDA